MNQISTGFRWATRGSWAVLDQALFAGTNFLTNVLLARWLPETEYGAFVIAFSLLLMIGSFHTSFLTEPMMVFGPAKYSGQFSRYLGLLLMAHVAFALLACLLCLVVAMLLGRTQHGELQSALFGLAVAAPLVLLLWLMRRALYVRSEPAWAAAAGSLYLVLQVVALSLLSVEQHISVFTALVAMGASSLCAASLILLRLRPAIRAEWVRRQTAPVTADHSRYARWSLGTLLMTWLGGNLFFFLLPIWHGLEATGSLRAILNLAMPALQVIGALSLLLLPTLVRQLNDGGSAAMFDTARAVLLYVLAGSGLFFVLLMGSGRTLLDHVYAGKYGPFHGVEMLLVGLLPLSAAVTAVVGSSLRALNRPDLVFWAYGVSTLVGVAIGFPLVRGFGVSGALLALVASSMTTAATMTLLARRVRTAGPETVCP